MSGGVDCRSAKRESPATQTAPRLVEALLVDPQEGPRLVGFAFVLYGGEAVPPLAMVSLVVVVKLHLPDSFKGADVGELEKKKKSIEFLTLTVIPLGTFRTH